MRVKIEEVPLDLRRRVAQRLESIRGTPLAEGADDARLGDEACPIYRPDLKEIAYWEIEIAGLKATQARDREGEGAGAGFMLATAGRHDLPLSHWSLGIESPSRALEAKAGVGKVARIVKLDTLAYAAEDEVGTYLAHLGQFPPLVSGISASSKTRQGISTMTALPVERSENDEAPAKLSIATSGAAVPTTLKVGAWRSWADAKRRYAAVYKYHLQALAEHAASSWAIEDLLAKFGEGIREGQRITVPLLKAGKARVSGDGAKAVRLTRIDRQPLAVQLDAVATGRQGEASFQLDIFYEDGSSESLPYFVVPKDTPSNFRSLSPNN
jgi:hypothetical protein